MSNDKVLRDLEAAMQQYGADAYPQEACGLLIATKTGKTEVIPCKNVHEDPRAFFRIDRIDYTRAADRGKVIGVWHTHPNGKPEFSDADRVGCEVSGTPWYLMSVVAGAEGVSFSRVATMAPSGFTMPYTGRPYVPGVFDCWTMVVDYYAREYGIVIKKYDYTLHDGTPGARQFERHYQDEGFVRLVNEEPRRGDVFFIQDAGSPYPNHAAIYLDGDVILHHTLNRLSRHDIYGGYYQKHTVIHARHKDLMS